MTDEDRMTEYATKDLPKALTSVAIGIMLFIMAPGAAATDPFFRKNMGIRAFTGPLAVISIIVWILLWLATPFVPWFCSRIIVNLTAWCLIVVYTFLAWQNLSTAKKSFSKGIQWHSKSKGESRFGTEVRWHILLIEAPVAAALFAVSPILGGYFIFSRQQSYLADLLGIARVVNQYLDIIDARIEARYLETALNDGVPPGQTAGMYQPLPRHLKGQLRAEVARVAAGIRMPPGGVSSQWPTATPTTRSVPPSSETVASSSSPQSGLVARKDSKSKIYIGFIALLTAALAGLAVAHFRHTKAYRNFAVIPVRDVNKEPVRRQMITKPPPSLPVRAVVRPQSPDPPSVVLPSSKIPEPPPTLDSNAVAQAIVLAQKNTDAQKKADLETQKYFEDFKNTELEAQRQVARQKLLGKINSTIAAQKNLLAQCKSDWLPRLDANTNRIAEVTRSKRQPFLEENQSARDEITKLLTKADDKLPQFQISFQTMSADPKSDPTPLNDDVTAFAVKFEKARQSAIAMLGNLDDDIAKAAKKTGFLNIK